MRTSRIKTILLNASGMTLVELLIGISILTLITGLLGSSLFQTFSIERFWRDDVIATKEWRHAGSYLAGDALNAKSTSLIDGAPPVGSLTLNWTDSAGAVREATYSLSGATLVRTFQGKPLIVTNRVVSVSFYRAGQVLTFDLEVTADRGGTERASLKTYLRWLQ